MFDRRCFFKICLGASLTILSGATAFAQTAPILSGEDRFHPVIARSGMVASQERLASEVGVDILKKGGNAVDAAVAVGFALAVTLPRAGNLGGGGFMIIHEASSKKTEALDYRERAPEAAYADMFLNEEGVADSKKSRYSGLAVGVPGTVAGLHGAFMRYGSGELSWGEVVAPAISLARDGFPVSEDLSGSLKSSSKRLLADEDAASIFYKSDGGFYEPGELLVQEDLAATLEAIAQNGPAAFYEGSVATAISAKVKASGGAMTPADLADYAVKWRAPISGSYRGYEVVSMPPPSSGGVHIIEILNMLEPFDLKAMGANSAATIHLMAEAMKRAYADRSKYLGDPDFVDVPVKGLTRKDYAAERMRGFSAQVPADSAQLSPGNPLPYESDETTHFSVVDSQGNAVSNTYTLNFSYGVGMVAPGTGVLLNNELDDFSAKAGVPNAYGLIGGKANAVAPRKRPLSSMSPTMVFKDGELTLVTGSPGGSRIITTVLQVILNVIDHGMNIAEASNAPRVHHQWLPEEIRIEEGVSPDTVQLLERMGHKVARKNVMGSTQSIVIDGESGLLSGASDPRVQGALTAGY